MNRRAIIDTGAIYAFVTRNDIHHKAAKEFSKHWLDQKGVFVLPDIVFAETMTLLKARLGSQAALQAGRLLRRNPAFDWLALGADGELDTWAAFQRFHDKEWSYTDCAILVMAQREKISKVFAFDHHFSQMAEIERVPQ